MSEYLRSRKDFVGSIIPFIVDTGSGNAFRASPALQAVTTEANIAQIVNTEVTHRIVSGRVGPDSVATRIADIVTAICQEFDPRSLSRYPHPLGKVLLDQRNPSWQRLTALYAIEEFIPFLQKETGELRIAESEAIQSLLISTYTQDSDGDIRNRSKELLIDSGLAPAYEAAVITIPIEHLRSEVGYVRIKGSIPLKPFGSGIIRITKDQLEIEHT